MRIATVERPEAVLYRPMGSNGDGAHVEQQAAALVEFPLTDTGTAERVITEDGGRHRFCSEYGRWLEFDGRRWIVRDECGIHLCAKRVVRALKDEANGLADRKQASALWAFAHKMDSNRKLKDVIECARKEPGVKLSSAELDRDPSLFNVRNGTLDLRAFELRRHRRDDLITKLCDVDYDPAAMAPRWIAFLDRIFGGNRVLIGFIRRVFGYCLTGLTSERALFILQGVGANGKSTLLAVLRALLFEYFAQLPAGTLMARKYEGIPNDIARLKGARVACAIETDEGRHLAEGAIKQMTGGEDVLSARFMRGEWFDFRPEFKLFIATNHKPVIRGTDNSIWDRVKLIPFDVVIPEAERDPQLTDKLLAELPGILAWSVEGNREWQSQGLGVPDEVRRATSGYRRDMDTLGAFIETHCITGHDDGKPCEASAGNLYSRYRTWAEGAGERVMSQKMFG